MREMIFVKEEVFVYGASGHAKVVADILEKGELFTIALLVDDDPALKGKTVYGYQVRGAKEELLAQKGGPAKGIVAIGSNLARRKVAGWLAENGFDTIAAVHPSAQLARGVSVGRGTAIMAGAVVNSDAVIGEHGIINTGATVDHDCSIGDWVHIAPGATLCGSVTVGAGSFIGAGARILPNLTIGCNVTIGAGATVTSNIPDGVIALGTPARMRKPRKESV